MSDTPRTDREVYTVKACDIGFEVVNPALTRILERESAALRRALIAVLPMAKGYAASHPVGRNAQMVAEAQALADSRELTPCELAAAGTCPCGECGYSTGHDVECPSAQT